MKLKKFTQVETHQLIADLNQYWKLCSEITETAKTLFEDAYTTHTRDFKWSLMHPFTFREKSLEDLTHSICGGQIRSVYDEFIFEKGFTTFLSCWYGEANGDYTFTQKHHAAIVDAAAKVGFWRHDHIGVFHDLLENHAEHPLVPDSDDIQLIKLIRSRLVILQTYMDAYNNAI